SSRLLVAKATAQERSVISTLLTLQSIDAALTVIFCALAVIFRFLGRPKLARPPPNRPASTFLSAAPSVREWEATMAASASALGRLMVMEAAAAGFAASTKASRASFFMVGILGGERTRRCRGEQITRRWSK